MALDYATLKKTARGRVLLMLSDLDWHSHLELCKPSVGGPRYPARVLELKRLGYRIESRALDDGSTGNEYRLKSVEPSRPKGKRVRVYLDEADVIALLGLRGVPRRAKADLTDALGSFQANRGKL